MNGDTCLDTAVHQFLVGYRSLVGCKISRWSVQADLLTSSLKRLDHHSGYNEGLLYVVVQEALLDHLIVYDNRSMICHFCNTLELTY